GEVKDDVRFREAQPFVDERERGRGLPHTGEAEHLVLEATRVVCIELRDGPAARGRFVEAARVEINHRGRIVRATGGGNEPARPARSVHGTLRRAIALLERYE